MEEVTVRARVMACETVVEKRCYGARGDVHDKRTPSLETRHEVFLSLLVVIL
jgi:hypothetical protein